MKEFNIDKAIPAFFDEREEKLTRFVHKQHSPQTRKYTGLPYVTHLLSVASAVKEATGDSIMTATALAHDLFEDTACQEDCLRNGLRECGYSPDEVHNIVQYVWDLTDRFTKKKFPRLNRRERKKREAQRLSGIHIPAKNVKLADIYDNLGHRLMEDEDFARVYLREAGDILPHLEIGNKLLFEKLKHKMQEARDQLETGSTV